ncbi:MAG: DUF1460 domain-containing protein [Candidatus Obscuribacterales bacterium]
MKIESIVQSRRAFLQSAFAACALLGIERLDAVHAAQSQVSFQGEDVFNRIVEKAKANNWRALPIGELMGKIAKEFEGTPYKGGTLEIATDHEVCSVNLGALDCVTFFESTLDFARMLKLGGSKPADLLAQVRYTRYRGGKPGDYSTRLHYTTDWYADNVQKHVIKLLAPEMPGAQPFTQPVGFMTANPDKYKQLAADPKLVEKMKHHEAEINARSLKYIPLDKLAAVEPLLKTGDLVGVCTKFSGLDIAHTGLVYRTEDGVAHFMDASSKKANMKVTIEPGPISKALSWSSDLTGAMFARPLEPKA